MYFGAVSGFSSFFEPTQSASKSGFRSFFWTNTICLKNWLPLIFLNQHNHHARYTLILNFIQHRDTFSEYQWMLLSHFYFPEFHNRLMLLKIWMHDVTVRKKCLTIFCNFQLSLQRHQGSWLLTKTWIPIRHPFQPSFFLNEGTLNFVFSFLELLWKVFLFLFLWPLTWLGHYFSYLKHSTSEINGSYF